MNGKQKKNAKEGRTADGFDDSMTIQDARGGRARVFSLRPTVTVSASAAARRIRTWKLVVCQLEGYGLQPVQKATQNERGFSP